MHIRILQETISNMVWDIRYHLVTWQTPPAAPNGSIIEAAARNLVTPIHQHDAPSKTSRLSDNIHRVSSFLDVHVVSSSLRGLAVPPSFKIRPFLPSIFQERFHLVSGVSLRFLHAGLVFFVCLLVCCFLWLLFVFRCFFLL